MQRPWHASVIKKHDPFYDSKTWKVIRKHKLLETPFCEYCDRFKHITIKATVVDHILSRRFYPQLEEEEKNLHSCCNVCHNKKRSVESRCADRFRLKAELIKRGYITQQLSDLLEQLPIVSVATKGG
jgi:5-methylcytosine-specific restriction endonuclease McrA